MVDIEENRKVESNELWKMYKHIKNTVDLENKKYKKKP
jgi:hypothetical protein